ncbi:DUF917 domain-containing protein [Vibrio sp. WJH972]
MGRILTLEDVDFAIKGGSIYACGGGGWVEHGRMLGTAAVSAGQPELVTMDEVEDDAWIATAAAIGAPGESTNWQMLGMDYVKAAQLLQEELGAPLHGLIIGQNGMSSTLNAWLPSAVMGTKVIDAVGDLRAHPTGDMGSLGLASSTEQMIQTVVGGHRDSNSYIELTVRGATAKVSPILRKASDMSGGFIASCRNPIRASYVKKHAALGGISMALGLGQTVAANEGKGTSALLDAICNYTEGNILATGVVSKRDIVYTGQAFDVGTIQLKTDKGTLVLHVMNEYMAVETLDGERLATYPDVITTLDENGSPVSVGRVKEGMKLHVFHIPMNNIPLSSSVKDPLVYPEVEEALGINLSDYALK